MHSHLRIIKVPACTEQIDRLEKHLLKTHKSLAALDRAHQEQAKKGYDLSSGLDSPFATCRG